MEEYPLRRTVVALVNTAALIVLFVLILCWELVDFPHQDEFADAQRFWPTECVETHHNCQQPLKSAGRSS